MSQPSIEAAIRRSQHLARSEAITLVHAVGSALLETGVMWETADRHRRPIANFKPEALLAKSAAFAGAGCSSSVHAIRLVSRFKDRTERLSLILRVRRDELDHTGDADLGIDLRWMMPDDAFERAQTCIAKLCSVVWADEALVGPRFNVNPAASSTTLVRKLPDGDPPPGVTLSDRSGMKWLDYPLARSEPQEKDVVATIGAISDWIAGRNARVEAPVRLRIERAVPTFLLGPRDARAAGAEVAVLRSETAEETQALPQPDELKAMIARAEPRAALRGALPIREPSPPAKRATEAADDAGATAIAPPSDEIKDLIARTTPFRESISGPPMPVDDYAALQALGEVRGEHDESVRKRYGTDSLDERRALDRRMDQYLARRPLDLARYEERLAHFLKFLRGESL
jgi:hypothetical protein